MEKKENERTKKTPLHSFRFTETVGTIVHEAVRPKLERNEGMGCFHI